MVKSLEKDFNEYCINNNLEINKNQIEVIKKLENFSKNNFKPFLYKLFSSNSNQKAFYLFGDVGVGKTMILNFFFEKLKVKKLRKHFNEFMINFHDFAHTQREKQEENIINLFVRDLKKKASLIYFDEFQVTNIVDAMILGKLYEQIFKEDIKIILTSNTKISELYKDGLQRDQFKSFIDIMNKKSIEHELEIDEDYRKSKENFTERYFYPLN